MTLPEPHTPAGRLGLAEIVATPARAVIAVDYDGTLAPIVERPEDARPARGATGVLKALATTVGVVAVVSGRAARDVVALAGLDDIPRLHVLGHYGLEAWHDGTLDSPAPDPAVDAARARLAATLANAPQGVHLEDKHHSLVVHTRPATDPARALETLRPEVTRLAAELGLEVVPGRYVLEIRPAGVDKGHAVRRLAAGWGSVLYAGDDLGDLPAYAAVEELRAAGTPGLTVASAGQDAPAELAARADLVLDGPTQIAAFLADLARVVGAG